MKTADVTLLILAGGFGTRLSKVVSDVPKPLAPVAGKPFLHYVLATYLQQGVSDFVFLVHHMAGKVVDYIETEQNGGLLTDCRVRFVEEHEPLGTGGAVANAVKELGLSQGFLVTNADTWLSAGVDAVYGKEPACMAVLEVSDTSRYGKVKPENGLVAAFEEKRPDAGPGFINAGLYYLEPMLFAGWDGAAFSMETAMFPQLVAKQQLHAAQIDSNFIDIGIPEDYYRFCGWIEGGRKQAL